MTTEDQFLAMLEQRETAALEKVRACERTLASDMDHRVRIAGVLPPVTSLPALDIVEHGVALSRAIGEYVSAKAAVDEALRMLRRARKSS